MNQNSNGERGKEFTPAMPTESKTLNFNTYFLAVLIAMSGWTLTTVHGLSKDLAALTQKTMNNDREIVELRARLAAVEALTQANALAIARLRP